MTKSTGKRLGVVSPTASLPERLWPRLIRQADGCWVWPKADNGSGYGKVSVGGGKLVYAHRLAYELTNGPIPNGLSICHRCDNPPCCNPDHLFLGTHSDNIRDASAKRRLGFQRHPEKYRDENHWTKQYPDLVRRGSVHHRAKLTEDNVRSIRQMQADRVARKEIAARFNVTEACIKTILGGYTWKHVA